MKNRSNRGKIDSSATHIHIYSQLGLLYSIVNYRSWENNINTPCPINLPHTYQLLGVATVSTI
jgi:hypothetical protein